MITSYAVNPNPNEITAFINVKTGDLIRVSYDVNSNSPRNKYKPKTTHFWTFSNRCPVIDKPYGYDDLETDSLNEALGYILGFKENEYQAKLSNLRKASSNLTDYFCQIFDLAEKKGLFVEPLSVGDRYQFYTGIHTGFEDRVVGFVWQDRTIDNRNWDKELAQQLAEYNSYEFGDVYCIEHFRKGMDFDDCVLFNLYIDPFDKEQILNSVNVPNSQNPDNWARAQPVGKVAYQA